MNGKSIILSLALSVIFTTVANGQSAKQCAADIDTKLAAAIAKGWKVFSEVESGAAACVTKHPTNPEVNIAIGRVLLEGARFKEALAKFEAAISNGAASSEAYYGRGEAHYGFFLKDSLWNDKSYPLALADFEKALSIDPTHYRALLGRTVARAIRISGGQEALVADYNRVAALAAAAKDNRALAKALHHRGLIFYGANKYKEAMSDFTASLNLDPDQDLYRHRAQLHRWDKNFEAELLDLASAIEKSGRTADVHSRRAEIYEERGLTEKAIAELRYGINLAPNDQQMKDRLAKLLKNQAANKPATPTTAQPKSEAESAAERGLKEMNSGKFAEAIESFSACIRLMPNAAPCHLGRGAAYLQSGKGAQSIADFNKAVELQPQGAEIYIYRGMALYQQNQKDKAVADFRKALSIDPNNAQAKNALQKIGEKP